MPTRDVVVRSLAVAAIASALGCSDDEAPIPHAPPVDAGAPEADAPGCAPGEVGMFGNCLTPGIPPDACASGFEADGRAGCAPILPAAPCPAGTMALPGETRCHPVADCGDAPWGNIPVEADTQYVDASYAGGDSDGTAGKPWTTIQAAITSAAKGAIVAIAEGKYPEAPFLGSKSLRVWGRCPDKVEISSDAEFPAFVIDADGAELHGVAITTTKSFGLLLGPGDGIVIDRVWVHDTGDVGIFQAGFFGPSTLTVSSSLIEGASGAGVLVIGAPATLDGIVVRAGKPAGEIGPGRGIDIEDDADTGARADVAVKSSIVEQNHESGVVVFGSDVTLDATVVRGTLPHIDDRYGLGIAVQSDKEAAKVSITGSVVTGNRHIGVSVVASSLAIQTSVIEGTLAQKSDGFFGDALCVIRVGRAGDTQVTNSTIRDSARSGIGNFGATVQIAGTAFQCNPIQLDGETTSSAFNYQDLGGNGCGCDEELAKCQVLSTDLQAPQPLP